MSASTAPAAVPEPNNTPATTTGTTPQSAPAPGLLASMLAPVEPARTTAFSLDPQTADSALATGAARPSEGVSSTDFHGAESGRQDTSDTKSGDGSEKKKQGVMRAWLLAGAARWARGGGTQNKRLDMQKARAMAHQVKEARQVAVNKSGGLGGGTTGTTKTPNASGASGGKSLDSKSPKGSGSTGDSASKGPKNSTNTGGGTGRGPAGRDTNRNTDRTGTGPKQGSGGNGGGRGTSGGSFSAKDHNRIPKQTANDQPRTPKPSKDTSSSSPKSSKGDTAGGRKSGTQDAAGTPGKSGTSGKTDQPKKTTDTPKDTAPKTPKGETLPTPKDGASTKQAPGRKDATDKATSTGESADGKRPKLSLIKRNDKTKTPPASTEDKTTKTGDKPKTTPDATSNQPKPKTDTPATTRDGKPFTTRPSRETGYRDGTRIARTTAHVKAYRDGVKDGITDTTEAADREKARLDQAHADRKKVREDHMQNLTPTIDQRATYNPDPLPVKDVTSTHVLLGDGADRDSLTRGEVRSLKQYERRLEAKATVMQKIEDVSRALKAHADQQTAKVTQLVEQARAVKGGDKLIGKLAKMQEAAATQAAHADDLHTRAIRSIDTTTALLLNVRSRYEDMYKAVVDSPETAPAELNFYLKG